LVGGQSFRIFPVLFDQELADMIVERERWFWEECVLKRMPPAPTTIGDLSLLYAADNGGSVEATPEIEQALEELRLTKAHTKANDAHQAALEFAIKAHLGEAAILTGSDGRTLATWKSQTSNRFDQTRLKTEEPETYARFQTESNFRVLRIK
jgi:predicted phage-related endonuclease